MQWRHYAVNNEQTVENFFLSMNTMRTQMHGFIKSVAKHAGLTGQEFIFLMAIDHFDHVTVGKLSQSLHVQQANVSKMMRELESQELIIRIPDETDSRTFTLLLSKKAKAIMLGIQNKMQEVYNDNTTQIDLDLVFKGVAELSKLIGLFESDF